MNDVRLAVQQIGWEQRSFWRNPASAVFTFAFPILFLVIFASVNAAERLEGVGDLPYNQYYVPSIVAFGLMSACYTNLAIVLSYHRDSGALKRLRGTPMPAWMLLAGLVGSSLVVSVVLTALTTTVGVVFYDVTFPGHWIELAVVLLLGGACFATLGATMSGLVPNADAAPAVVNIVFFPLVFISGTFFPIDPESFFGRVASYFPVKHLIDAIFTTFDPRVDGWAFAGFDLLVLAGWTVAGASLAARHFSWEPRR